MNRANLELFKMKGWRVMVWVSWLLWLSGGLSMKLNENGEYTNIVIKIEDYVPEDACEELLNNLKGLLTRTSQAVHTALDKRLWPGQFTLVVPSHWGEERCEVQFKQAKGQTRYQKPDMMVETNSFLSKTAPTTHQSQGCRRQGDFISLPQQFISNWNTSSESLVDSGKLLAHEFIKLRFGIFDEIGFPDDLLYPSQFKMNGVVYPSGVSNTEVEGNWVHRDGKSLCKSDLKSCSFHPRGPNQAVTCSLGYLPFLETVQTYCRPGEIRFPAIPTKQTVLCDGESAWDVINNSDDVKLVRERMIVKKSEVTPRIDIVREVTPTHVLVLEISASMAENDDWKFINKAAHKLIRYDLPDSARLGVVSFSNESKLESPLTIIRGSRNHLADIIPDKYRLAKDDERCVLCGINMAMTEVLGEHKEGAHIIIITRGSSDTLSIMEETVIKEYVEYYQIHVSVIIVPKNKGTFLTFYDELAHMSGGRAYVVKEESVMRKYSRIISALEDISDDSANAVTVHHEITRVSALNKESSGSFLIDSSLGRNTQFGILVEDEEDHLIESVHFTDEHGAMFGPFSHIATTFDNINLKTINFGLAAETPFEDESHIAKEWKYLIKWHKPGPVDREAAVVVSSEPRSAMAETEYKIRMWTDSDQIAVTISPDSPLVMYVEVRRGSSPILRASVQVYIDIVTDDSSTVKIGPLDLFDNGNGDPDNLGGNGVYSRYLLEYPAVGRYSFTVHVKDIKNKTAVIRYGESVDSLPKPTPLKTCCGSRTNVEENKLVNVDPFRRVKVGSVKNLIQVPDPLSADQIAPSKIVDLHIKVLMESTSLLATWTAPGDDFDTGSVSGYKFMFSSRITQLLDPQAQVRPLVTFGRKDNVGEKVRYEFQFKHFDKDFYVGLVGIDTANNSGKISNLVNVFMPYPTQAQKTVIESNVDMSAVDGQWMMISALCGSILLLTVFLIIGVLFFLKFKSKKIPMATSGHRDDLTDNTSCSSDARNTSSHNLMPDVTNVTRMSPVFTAPPASLPDSTPTYWSATMLLTEHEQRALALSYGNFAGPGPLSSVREEYIGYPEEYPEDSMKYEISDGETNLAFRHSNVTPVHAVFGSRDQLSLSSDEEQRDVTSAASSRARPDSACSEVSNLYVEQELDTPVRFSTAVQTIAPSTIATLRQNNTYLAGLRTRSVSLV